MVEVEEQVSIGKKYNYFGPACIYKITNKINGKFYVGSTNNSYRRRAEHFSLLRMKNHKNRKLQFSFNKYGEENFEFSIIEEIIDLTTLIEREQFYIDSLKPILNLRETAEASGTPIKRKINQYSLNGVYIATYDSIAEAARMTKLSYSAIISALVVKRNYKSGAGYQWKYFNGHVENLPAISEKKHTRKIYQYSKEGIFIKEWLSIIEASSGIGTSKSNIDGVLSGNRKTAGGYQWRYEQC